MWSFPHVMQLATLPSKHEHLLMGGMTVVVLAPTLSFMGFIRLWPSSQSSSPQRMYFFYSPARPTDSNRKNIGFPPTIHFLFFDFIHGEKEFQVLAWGRHLWMHTVTEKLNLRSGKFKNKTIYMTFYSLVWNNLWRGHADTPNKNTKNTKKE